MTDEGTVIGIRVLLGMILTRHARRNVDTLPLTPGGVMTYIFPMFFLLTSSAPNAIYDY